jgi:hypothetical protein
MDFTDGVTFTAPDTLTIVTDGTYHIDWSCTFQCQVANNCYGQIFDRVYAQLEWSGETDIYTDWNSPVALKTFYNLSGGSISQTQFDLSFSDDLKLSAGDTLKVKLHFDSAKFAGMKYISPRLAIHCIGSSASGNTDVRVRITTFLAVTNNTNTTISWGASVYQHGSLWASSPNPSRLVAPSAGRYLVICEAPTNISASVDDVELSLLVNGSQTDGAGGAYGFDAQWGVSGAGTLYPRIVSVLDLAANDYVEFSVYITDGTAASHGLQSYNTWASMALI